MKKIMALLLAVMMMLTAALAFGVNAESTDPSDSYTHIDAEHEDGGISLWFDYASEKISPDDTESTGMESFSVYMAKNEIENAQFVLTANGQREGMTAELSGFENEVGDTLEADIFIEYYHDCDNYGMVPDAIPPLSAYGPFSLTEGKSQAFLVKITSKEDSTGGWYSSGLTVKDAEGNAVKYAKIFVYVWDFALSEATACATSIGLAPNYLNASCAGDGLTVQQRYKVYYDYLLENRVTSMHLPYELHEAGVVEYMDNPRVTSYQIQTNYAGSTVNTAAFPRLFMMLFSGENAKRYDKAYYFDGAVNKTVLDPLAPEQLEALKADYEAILPVFEKYKPAESEVALRYLCTYFADIDYTLEDGTVIDQIDYYDDFVNLLCSKPFAYTESWELDTPGAKVMQGEKWDAVYGPFKDRMAEYKAAGNKLWWFISWDVEAPYINYYMQTDGVSQRLLFWQQYDCGVEGFLYNFSNFWIGDCSDPYSYNITDSSKPDAHGASILVYPGTKFGLTTPVGSLRLEAMRDGIEDYQLFTMLDAKREGASALLIDKMTQGVVTYSTSDEDYYRTRIALGNAVEAAEKGECAHSYALSAELSTAPTCTEAGENVYLCNYCGESYGEEILPLGHSYEEGKCTACGEADPDYSGGSDFVVGDIDGDGKINAKDSNLLKRIVSGSVTPTDTQRKTGDINGDGALNAIDANLITRVAAGSN